MAPRTLLLSIAVLFAGLLAVEGVTPKGAKLYRYMTATLAGADKGAVGLTYITVYQYPAAGAPMYLRLELLQAAAGFTGVPKKPTGSYIQSGVKVVLPLTFAPWTPDTKTAGKWNQNGVIANTNNWKYGLLTYTQILKAICANPAAYTITIRSKKYPGPGGAVGGKLVGVY